jgi:lipopolysaccharide export system permease protein
MKSIDSYILRQVFRPLLAVVVIALLVLLTERMLRLLDLVLDTGGGLTVLLQMLAFLVPHYMALALPAAFFLGVLLAFSSLHHNRELDALGSAGIGLPRLMRPVLGLTLVLTLLTAVNFAIGQPYTRYIYRALVHEVSEAAANVYLQERTFIEVKGVTFMSERIWRNSQEFSKVFIFEESDSGKATAMTATRGSLYVAPKGEKSTLLLRDGVRLEGPLPGEQAQPGASDYGALTFSQTQIPIDLVGQAGFRPRGDDERELTLFELWRYRNNPPEGATYDEMVGAFHDRIVRTLAVPFLPFLAVPFALGARRSRQFAGVAVGLVLLAIFNEVLNTGNSLASNGRASNLLAQWLPLAIFAAGSLALFWRAAYKVKRGGGLPWPPPGLLGRIRFPAGLGLGPRRQRPSE